MEKITEVAEAVDLPKTGTKEELLQRISLNCSLEDLSAYLPHDEIYSLTEKGKQYLEKEKDLLDLYQNRQRYHVTYNEYAFVESNHREMSYQDILFQVMNTRFQKYAEDTEYAKVQEEYLYMYELLKDGDKRIDALNALLSYFFMDLNVFADTFNYIEEFKRSSKTVPEFLKEVPVPVLHINTEVVEKICGLKDCYQTKTAESISKNNVSYYVNTEKFLAILDQVFNGTFNKEATEEAINSKIPSVLDYQLRNVKQ